MEFPCPCCGFLTFDERPGGTFLVCPVCYWEDDNVQLQDPNYAGGANSVCLNKARENFMEFGAVEKKFLKYTRQQLSNEVPKTK